MRKHVLIALFVTVTAAAAFASGANEDESFSSPDIHSIEIRGEFLNVEVTGDRTDAVSMRSDLPEDTFFEPRNFTVMHEVDGAVLRVWVEHKGLFSSGRGTLFFRVPDDTRIDVDTASGSVRVDGVHGTDFHVTSASGALRISDIASDVTAKTASGGIKAARIRGDTDLSTSSGSIDMSDVEGRVRVGSVSGSIQADHIKLTDDSQFRTVSGDIRVDLDNDLNDLRYDLSTVSGRLTVGSVRASRGLQMGDGSLLLRGETVSGSQSYQ